MSLKYWTQLLIVLTSCFILLIVLFNLIVDPYGVFNIVNIEKFNKTKNYISGDGRTKFYSAKRSNPEILLMGTSRTENINPQYLNKYLDGRVYNLATKGSGVTLHKKNIEYFIKNYNIKSIVYGMDLFSFNPATNLFGGSLEKTRYNDYYITDYINVLLGTKQFSRSIKTIKSNIKDDSQLIDLDIGWATNVDNLKKIKSQGIESITTKVINNDLFVQKHFFNNEEFKNIHSIDKSLKILDDIVELCKKNNVKLYLFTSPVYSKINTLIEKRGYGDTYNYWKKALSKYEEVYDFNGYNTITNDINNFYDGHHYVDEISKLILARIFNDTEVVVPKDFGSIIKEK